MSFQEIKQKAEKIFIRFVDNAKKMNEILQSCSENTILKEMCKETYVTEMKNIEKKLDFHLVKIKRSKMKCTFFGQTSNGKSSLINALLGKNVLPIGDGRTTSCFITIEHSKENPYLMINDIRENDIEKFFDSYSETYDKKSKIKDCIQLFYPSNFLNENVQLLDSPGADFSDCNDGWIEKYCLDSDIFVYVVNGTATINKSERQFFRKVTDLIKNPNILVVMNKWDLCNVTTIEKTKKQQYDTVNNLLCEYLELNCDPRKKTFFLSAKEELKNCERLDHIDNQVINVMGEFKTFIDTLSKEMSKRAIINKIGPDLDKGVEYLSEIAEVLKQFKNLLKHEVPEINNKLIIIKINELIKPIFDKIIEEGTKEIKDKSLSLLDSIINNAEYNTKSILENISESLTKTFEKHINETRSTLKNLFIDCTWFQLSDEVQNGYLPTTSISDILLDSIKRGNSKAQGEYNNTRNVINNALSTTIINDAAELGVDVSIMHMHTSPEAMRKIICILRIVAKSSSWYTKYKNNNNKEDLRKNIENFITENLTNSFKNIQDEIANEVNQKVDALCHDHEEALRLIKEIDDLRSSFETIATDMQLIDLNEKSSIEESSN